MSSELEKLLRDRLVEPSKYPPFYKFEKEKEELIGEINAVRKIKREDGEDTIFSIKTADGKEYSIPSYTVLSRLFSEQQVKVGDYVLIRYEGEQKTRRGRPAKLFSLGKISKEELLKLKPEAPPKIEGLEKEKEFLNRLFEFYPDGITRDDLQRRLAGRGFTITVEEAIKIGDLTEKGGLIVKKR